MIDSARWSVPIMIAGAFGPLAASAEAIGQFEDLPRSVVVYAFSALTTVVTLMIGVLMFFLKKEHASITHGIKTATDGIAHLTSVTGLLAVNVEQHLGELRTEVARRVLVEEHGRSAARLHEKVNRLDRTLAYMRAKMGLHPDDEPPENGEQ